MALSGSFTGSTSNQYVQPKITWSAVQSISGNYSDVTATLTYSRTNSGYTTYGTWNGSITINGTKTSGSKQITITQNSNTHALTATTRVYHNADGSKAIIISAAGSVSSVTSTNCSATVTLDTIPRFASITSAPNFNDEENPTIYYSNPAGNSVTTLKACISWTGGADIAYRDISKTGTSYTFNFTDAERKKLRAAAADTNSLTVNFFVWSIIGGNEERKYLSKTLTIVNSKPTLAPIVEDIDAEMLLLTGEKNKFVKFYSNPKYTMNATALKEATIKSVKAVCGGVTRTTQTGEFYNVEDNKIVFTVTDSRNNSTTKTVNLNMINYVKLTCNLKASIALDTSTTSKVSLEVSGNYFNGSFGSTANTITVQYRYKTNSGDYGEWQAITATLDGNTYKATTAVADLNYLDTFTFQARAWDKITIIESAEKPLTTKPVFDWGSGDFNINGTLGFGGAGAVLRRNSDNGNTVLSAVGSNDGIFIRPNGTGSNEAQSIFYNDGTISLNGFSFGANKILLNTAALMGGSQSYKLNEKISEQASGIVLIFSRYSNGAAENANFNFFFVPKQQVASNSGAGCAFNMFTVNFSVACCKYLYISDETISGNDLNTSSGTGASGIKYENSAYVLRYVIGV